MHFYLLTYYSIIRTVHIISLFFLKFAQFKFSFEEALTYLDLVGILFFELKEFVLMVLIQPFILIIKALFSIV
jgi:hypothetical protein